MKRSRIFIALALVLVVLTGMMMTGCSKAEPIAHDVVVMTINGRDITMEEYRYYYLGLKSDYDGGDESYWKNNESGRKGLKTLVETYIKQAAVYDKILADNGYAANAEDRVNVEKDIQDMKDMYESDKEFLELLAYNNLTEKMYGDILLRNEVLYRYLYDYNVKNKQDKMDKYLKDFVRAKHILVQFSTTTSSSATTSSGEQTRTKEEAKKLADEILKKIADGEDFDKLIKEYGEDPGMESNPDGYVFTYDEMVEEFEKAAFALDINGISEPVETTYGYHIIQRLEIDEEFQRENFVTIFNDDEFFEDLEALVEKEMEKMTIDYADIYDKVDIETVN
ncbi:MAG: peptidylprolyl isomerase [Clostridia bacterium]|nr:peptidylprolyl isomerase [Clostridia bacterium]